MTLQTYQYKINEQKELEIRYENLVEILKYYVLFSEIDELSFFDYDYEVSDYFYSFSVNKNEKIKKEDRSSIRAENEHVIVLEEESTIYGMLSLSDVAKRSEIVDELLVKVVQILKKIFNIKKQYLSQESMLDIYMITSASDKEFTNNLVHNLNVLLNANITIEKSVADITGRLKEKIKKSIIIYIIEDDSLLNEDGNILQQLNEFVLVVGPNNNSLPLLCGKLNVYKYITKNNFVPEQIKLIIEELKYKVQNKYTSMNNIITISGISGGIGTTTIAMNTANILAKKNQDKNVLFIDLSTTKAISNLFLEQNPLPKKTIIDLVNSDEFDIEKNLENGLVKVRENFYSINGIQKHIDSDILEKEIFIEKLLEYISKVSEKFNYIVIDTGEANATALNTTVYDISNELWIVTEMSLPHISKLKTFFSLMKRAGLKEKLTFLVNRYDSVNAISVSDVTSILNTTKEDNLNFDFKIPNDYTVLGYCWNYCELASNTHPKSVFINKLEKILRSRGLIKEEIEIKKESKTWLSFLSK